MTTTIHTVGVCGAGGTMGAGIAIVAARAGFRTISFDVSEARLDHAAQQTAAFFNKSVERGKLEPAVRDKIQLDMIRTIDLQRLADCDLVIEAVFEELLVKRELLSQLDRICPAQTIFASNTSTLSITEIAAGSSRPERVVGMHFRLPAQLMKLIELSPGIWTSEQTFQAAWAWADACGQIPVKIQNKPGFSLNALLVPFNNDAIRAVEPGVAEAADIDRAIKVGLGYRMGPLELIDLIDLDTQVRLCEAFYPITLDPPSGRRARSSRLLASRSRLAALRLLDEGLASQKDNMISKALFEMYGTAGYAPARRSVVAAERAEIRR